MSIELWVSFAVACFVLVSIPGPTVLLVVSYALGRGRQTAIATVPGVVLGDFTAMTVSLLGAGAIIAASATLFTVLKIVGALYLVWLGIGLWREGGKMTAVAAEPSEKALGKMFWNSWLVTALNPKGIVFFIAFVPQFVDQSQPVLLQFAVLEGTFLFFAGLNVLLWALLAGKLRQQFQKPGLIKVIKRLGGSFLVGAGLLTAMVQRA
ncbi:LysE family translocator [Sneathiella sp.]|jgi:threonine/homoserine/homoserine lactone efflux protein|uniref:LysE family translocator n=1 Tax=Sneathiella sp. TaxID=1964365 RepID=UPI0039E2D59A